MVLWQKKFLLKFTCFFSHKMKNMRSKRANESWFMQNMCVDKLIEIVKPKIFIKFHSTKIMLHLGWVANSLIIFSASYLVLRFASLADEGEAMCHANRFRPIIRLHKLFGHPISKLITQTYFVFKLTSQNGMFFNSAGLQIKTSAVMIRDFYDIF